MIVSQEPTPETTNHSHPVSSIIKTTVLSAFTFLTALSLRDVFIKTAEASLPAKSNEKLAFTYFYASMILLFTVLIAYLVQD